MLVNSSIRCPPRRFSRDAIARFTPLLPLAPSHPLQLQGRATDSNQRLSGKVQTKVEQDQVNNADSAIIFLISQDWQSGLIGQSGRGGAGCPNCPGGQRAVGRRIGSKGVKG